jgi:hypothetical protein
MDQETTLPDKSVATLPEDVVERAFTDLSVRQGGLSVRTRIENLEAEMLKHEQVECPLEHHFAPGLYARQIFIPKGTLLTGKVHKDDDISVLLQGDISVLTPEGMKRMRGPCTFVSKAGVKKLGYAHEDTWWTTIHANRTDESDIDKLEAILVTNDREDSCLTLEEIGVLPCL